MKRAPKLILALDVDSYAQAMRWVRHMYPKVKIFKVGLQLYTACGPKIIRDIRKTGAQVFLDLKLSDIPNTMVNATKELLKQRVAMFTVHTLSGPTALKGVARTCKKRKVKVLGVTILTSICPSFLKDLNVKRSLSQEVLYLARMAKRCGLDGIVCSVHEAKMIRRSLGRNFLICSPGIRPAGSSKGDQARAATPEEARRAGVDYMVVGRPILKARDPLKALRNL
ncbi:orotidine-5'-phosphate decarboxylase [Candidatus Omnitrophota bacterium]